MQIILIQAFDNNSYLRVTNKNIIAVLEFYRYLFTWIEQ